MLGEDGARGAAASLPREGITPFRECVGYFQHCFISFALVEEATVFRDALTGKSPLPAREDAEGAPRGRGGPMVP